MSQTGKNIETEFIFEEHEINDLMKFFTPNVEAEKAFMEGKLSKNYFNRHFDKSFHSNIQHRIGLLRTYRRKSDEILKRDVSWHSSSNMGCKKA